MGGVDPGRPEGAQGVGARVNPAMLVLVLGGALVAVSVLLGGGGVVYLSPNFSLAELTVSTTAERLRLQNIPGPAELRELGRLASTVLEPLRTRFGPLRITSGFRSGAVNEAVGGSSTSEHRNGRAVDLVPVQGSALAMFEAMRAEGWVDRLDLDQVIYYRKRGHVHIGIRPPGTPGRRQAWIDEEGAG